MAVAGWSGEEVRVVSVELAFDPPERASDLLALATHALDVIGLDLSDEGQARLRLDLTGSPLSDQYMQAGTCYTGARVQGTVRLSAEGQPDLHASVAGEVPTRTLIRFCQKDPAGAPFEEAFEIGLSGAMAELFGPSSVPYLTDVVATHRSGSHNVLLSIMGAAIDAYRTMERADVPTRSQYEFLDAAIWTIPMVMGAPDDASRSYVSTLRGLLLDHSETDFGFNDEDDVDAWRKWLTEWGAERGL
ncbi:MAG: hypothetical protein ACRDGT_06155 [Candidatus Limnocylindria bacterium]